MSYRCALHNSTNGNKSERVIVLFCHIIVLFCRLSEVGKLEVPKIRGKYDTGQLFLHRVFGYRGVVLFPWLARVYDRDVPNNAIAKVEKSDDGSTNVDTEPKGKTNTFYQVLIDSRDCPYIVSDFWPSVI